MLKKCLLAIIIFFMLSQFLFAGGVTIVTHGWNGSMPWVDDTQDKLVPRIVSEYLSEKNDSSAGVAEYLITFDDIEGLLIDCENNIEFGSDANTTGHAVIKVNWRDFAGSPTDLDGYATGVMAQWIVANLRSWANTTSHNFIGSPIHLIGHSRGGSMVGAMAEKLGEYGYWVDQVTFLDPHPTENRWNEDDWGEEGMLVPGNVIYAENYYREGDILEPNGEYVNGANNIKLSDSYFDDGYISWGYDRGYNLEHADVHAWYRGTIPSYSPPYDVEDGEDFQITLPWYFVTAYDDNKARPRNTTGYAFSLTANGGTNRPYEGIHSEINGSGQSRSFAPTNITPVGNVGYLTLRSPSVTAGETLLADYRYESWSSGFGVAFYLDTNRNPHDGYSALIGEYTKGESDGMEGVYDPALLTIPASQTGDTYYVFIKSTGSNAVRYFYAPMQLEVIGIEPPPPDREVTLTANADTFVSEAYQSYNYGSVSTIGVRNLNLNTDYYGLIKFNLDSIPAGSVIDDVELQLYCSSIGGDFREIRISESDSSWSESDVNWNIKPQLGSNYVYWHTVSGIGLQRIQNSKLTDLVEDWIEGTENNYGIYLLGAYEGDSFYFHSSEYSNSSYRPKLIINYTPPVPPDLIVTELYPVPNPTSDQFAVDQSVDWHVTVKNNGDGSADSSSVGYYLGTSSTDLSNLIDRDSIDALNGGSSDTAHDSYTFTESDVGQRYLICKADYIEDIEENSENNNTRVYGPFNVVLPKVSTPSISPNGGTFTGSTQVTLSCSTSVATIRYTTNGTTPTASSTEYTGAFTISSSCTVRACGFRSGYTDSDVASAGFTIIPEGTPVLSVTPDYQVVSANSAATSVFVNNTGTGAMSWTASVTSGDSWLSIQSDSSGTDSGTIIVAFDTNTTNSDREGTIRVTASGADGSPKDVTVRQAAPGSAPELSVTPDSRLVSANSGSTSFAVNNTGGYTMNWSALIVSDGSWLSIQSFPGGTDSGTIIVAFDTNTTNSDREGTIRVTAGAEGSPKFVTVSQLAPGTALSTNPNPFNGATNGSINTDTYWSNEGGATSYDVYFGTDSSPDSGEFKGNQTSQSYNPGTLAYSTTYYWQINAKNSNGTTTGDVWRFTTGSAQSTPPVVSNPNPANGATVSAGNSGQLLRVSALGATSGTIYYDDDSVISFSETGTINGDYLEATIPYTPGQMSGDGTNYWYVEATNASGSTRYPSSGNLMWSSKNGHFS